MCGASLCAVDDMQQHKHSMCMLVPFVLLTTSISTSIVCVCCVAYSLITTMLWLISRSRLRKYDHTLIHTKHQGRSSETRPSSLSIPVEFSEPRSTVTPSRRAGSRRFCQESLNWNNSFLYQTWSAVEEVFFRNLDRDFGRRSTFPNASRSSPI